MDMDSMIKDMTLITDEVNGMYYYVHELDHSVRLSPSFDYLEDAEQWKNRTTEIFDNLVKDDNNE
jgi:hypothetical protein